MRTDSELRRPVVLPLALATLTLIPACQQTSADQIVERVAEAMLTDGRMEDVRTLRITMTYQDHDYPVVTEISRPNRMRTEGVGNYVMVFDGERGAFLEPPPAEDGSLRDPELIEAKYMRDLELDIAFLFPAFFDHASEYLGRELVVGGEMHKLGVLLPLGVRLTYFIDSETYLPRRVVAEVNVDGTDYRPVRIFDDYASWDGMMYPRTVTYWWREDEVEKATVDLVEVNVVLGEDRFLVPAGLMPE